MSPHELEVQISCGAVIKELNPKIPKEVQDKLEPAKKIYRYRFDQEQTIVDNSTKRELKKDESSVGDEARCGIF